MDFLKSVLWFLASVAFVCAVGLGVGYAGGWLNRSDRQCVTREAIAGGSADICVEWVDRSRRRGGSSNPFVSD
jgi:hypothetical protein